MCSISRESMAFHNKDDLCLDPSLALQVYLQLHPMDKSDRDAHFWTFFEISPSYAKHTLRKYLCEYRASR